MTGEKLDTVRLQNMARAFINSAALFAAIDLKLFTAVAAGDNTVERFARRASISIINAERLMTMCAANGLLEWRGDHYTNAADVDRFLVEYEPRFERAYGFFWQIIKEVVERYLDCGNPRCGFARIRCPDVLGDDRRLRHRAFGPAHPHQLRTERHPDLPVNSSNPICSSGSAIQGD